MINRQEFQFLLVGVLFTAGVIFISIGLIYKNNLPYYIEAKYNPPIFNIPEQINRDFVIDIIDQVNIERKKDSLKLLKENSALSYAAYLRAKEILDNQYFNHYASGSGDIKAQKVTEVVGYRYNEVGENLARGYDDPNLVIEGWLNSPVHKQNMLKDNYREIGVAVLEGLLQGNNENIIVLLVGEPI